MADNKNELVTVNDFKMVPLDKEMAADMRDELAGLGSVSFDRVKFPQAGGLAFELPGEDEDHPITASEIVGIIVDHHPLNAYYASEYDPSNATPPECVSYDDVQGSSGKLCRECPHDKWGSARRGSGKACSNKHRLYLLLSDSPLPIILTIPATGIAPLRDYVAKRLLMKGLRPNMVLTRITLKRDKTKDGSTISRPVFNAVGRLTPEQEQGAKAIKAMCSMFRNKVGLADADMEGNRPMHSGEDSAPPVVDSEGFMDIPESLEEELPF